MAAQTGRGLALFLIATLSFPLPGAPKKGQGSPAGPPLLWRDPVDINTRNLVYGAGGEKDQPHGPFEFVKEDMNGTQPKFVIKDAAGVKWKLKLGDEARPETAASRFVWAAGYFADEDYFMPDLVVRNVPVNIHRGEKFIEPDGLTHNGRLKRYLKGEEKFGHWKWKENPFSGTRELDGLRVVMALINNWDLKDVNNSIYEFEGNQVYVVTDLGASFGSGNIALSKADWKGNLKSYTESKFIDKVTPTVVNFKTPGRPTALYAFAVPAYASRVNMEWLGRDIPIDDVRWIGKILAQLSPEQIQAAFGCAGFSPQEVAGFSATVESRIAELNKL